MFGPGVAIQLGVDLRRVDGRGQRAEEAGPRVVHGEAAQLVVAPRLITLT